MPAPKSTVHWVRACENDNALISCTIDEHLLRYQDPELRPEVRDPEGRTEAIKAKIIDPKQTPHTQSKLDAIMRPIARQITMKIVVHAFCRSG